MDVTPQLNGTAWDELQRCYPIWPELTHDAAD